MRDRDIAEEGKDSDAIARWESIWIRWRKPVIWILCLFALLLAYLFVYPVLFVVLDQSKLIQSGPDWMSDGLEYSVLPLIYLDEHVDLYTLYIEWLGDFLGV